MDKLYAIILHIGYRDEESFQVRYEEHLHGIASSYGEAMQIADEAKSDVRFDEQAYDEDMHGQVEIRSYTGGTNWKTETEIDAVPRTIEEQEACFENGNPDYYLEGMTMNQIIKSGF